jgi:hypothetical protein
VAALIALGLLSCPISAQEIREEIPDNATATG